MTDAPPPMGDNRPPPYDAEALDKLKAHVARAQEAHAKWQGMDIAADDEAAALNDYLGQVRKLDKAIEEARKAAKAPHEAAGKAVDAAFRPLASALDAIAKAAKAALTKFADAKEARLRAERARAEAEARAAREAAEAEAAKAAARGDLLAKAEAEEAARVAESEAARVAREPVRVQIGSATGAGRTAAMRTTWEAEVFNVSLAFMHFRDRAEIKELLTRLAAAEMRAAPVKSECRIPGVSFTERKAVA